MLFDGPLPTPCVYPCSIFTLSFGFTGHQDLVLEQVEAEVVVQHKVSALVCCLMQMWCLAGLHQVAEVVQSSLEGGLVHSVVRVLEYSLVEVLEYSLVEELKCFWVVELGCSWVMNRPISHKIHVSNLVVPQLETCLMSH